MSAPINQQQDNPREGAGFWAFHPVGRGIGAGAAAELFTNSTTFKSGFVYGCLSGLTNVTIRSLFGKKLNDDSASPEAKALKSIAVDGACWGTSYAVMQQLAKMTNNAFLKMRAAPALGIGLAGVVFGYANNDLLSTKRDKI